MRSLEFVIALSAVLATVAVLAAGAGKTSAAASIAFNSSLSSIEAGNYCFGISLLSSAGGFTALSSPKANYSCPHLPGGGNSVYADGELS